MSVLFPYAPRPFQEEIVATAGDVLLGGGHVVLESGTGTGKTVCALTAALTAAREHGKRVLYLTRTNAQERQVVLEYRRLRERDGTDGHVVALQGRTHLCPLAREDPDMGAANAEELGVMCRDRCRAADNEMRKQHDGGADKKRGRHVKPCQYYVETRGAPGERLEAWIREAAPTAEEVVAEATDAGACPYIANRDLLPDAEVVVAPYVYFLHPGLRTAFLGWCGASVEDFIVVVDEAHNVPDYARELASATLGGTTLERARKETHEFGNPRITEDVSLTAFLDGIHALVKETAREYVPDGADDALVPPDDLDVHLMSILKAPTPRIDKVLATVAEYGAAVRDARRRKGRVPRSHVGAVADFLRFWRQADEDTHVRLVRVEDADPKLECYAVDPGVVTRVLRDTAGSLHLSGTLAPLEEYRDSLGLPRESRLLRYPSPFATENRLTVFDPDVTTRYEDVRRDPGMWDTIGARLRALRDAVPDRNIAVFVPSYDVLGRVAPHLDGPRTVVDARGGGQAALMHAVTRFKEGRGGTLVSVMGGRLSEGVDFPEDALEVVVVVGLPYPKPSARQEALVRFYDRRFARGWEYAVRAPMTRKVLQAVGRLIRSPTDRGVALILDRRAALLREELPDLRASRDAGGDADRFFPMR